MDICEILARKKDSFEVTEWHPSAVRTDHNSVLDAVHAAKAQKPRELDADCKAGFLCPVPGCEKKYGRRFRVVDHMLLRHEQEGRPLFRCGEVTCLKTYDKPEALKSHQKTVGHKGSELMFEAAEDSTRSASTTPEVKLVEADNGLRYKCSFQGCGKSYSTRYRCSVHLTNCHGESNVEKPFICPAPGCAKAYATKDSLNRHKRICSVYAESVAEKKEIVLKKHDEVVRIDDNHPLDMPPSRRKKDRKHRDLDDSLSCEYQVTTEFKDRVQELMQLFDEI